MKHLLSLLGSLTMVGTTAATVGAWTNQTNTVQQQEVDWSVLESTIKEAQTVLEANKDKEANESTREALQDLVKEALAFVEKHEATQEEVDQAVLTIKTFIELFQESIKETASTLEESAIRSALAETINEADALLKTALKNQPIEKFTQILDWAKATHAIEGLQDSTYQAAIEELKIAMENFKIDYEIGKYFENKYFTGTELGVRGKENDDNIIMMDMMEIMVSENPLLKWDEFKDTSLDYRTYFEEQIVLMHGHYMTYELLIPIHWMV